MREEGREGGRRERERGEECELGKESVSGEGSAREQEEWNGE